MYHNPQGNRKDGFILIFLIVLILLISVITLAINRQSLTGARGSTSGAQNEKRYFQMEAVLTEGIFRYTKDIARRIPSPGESASYDGNPFVRILESPSKAGLTDAITIRVRPTDGIHSLSRSFRYHVYPILSAFEKKISPKQLAYDGRDGIYFADEDTHSVYRRDLLTGSQVRIAGTGVSGYSGDGGLAKDAVLNKPNGIAIDSAGNILVADTENHAIRRIIPSTLLIETICGNGSAGNKGDGGPAALAALNKPQGIHIPSSGDIYIADTQNHRIRKIDRKTFIIMTVAGTGVSGYDGEGKAATASRLNAPTGIFVHNLAFYIADTQNHRIRSVDLATGKISTLSGTGSGGYSGDDGPAIAARLNKPQGVFLDSTGNIIIADTENHRIRRVENSTQIITTIAGNGESGDGGDGGKATLAQLEKPFHVLFAPSGTLYLSDPVNGNIRAIDPSGKISSLVSGMGLGLDKAHKVVISERGDLYITDTQNHRIKKVSRQGYLSTVAGSGTAGFSGDGGNAFSSEMNAPRGITFGSNGDLFIADTENHRVRKISGSTGIITTIAGNGTKGYSGDGGSAQNAALNRPDGISYDASGYLFVADTENHVIRMINLQSGLISTAAGTGTAGYAGDGGQATLANLNAPLGIVVDRRHGAFYIADTGNHAIRKVDLSSGVITTAAGDGVSGYGGDDGASPIRFDSPYDITADDAGNLLVADCKNNRIRLISIHNGRISTIIGTGENGFNGDRLAAVMTRLNSPSGIAISSAESGHRIVVCDKENNRIRKAVLKPFPELY